MAPYACNWQRHEWRLCEFRTSDCRFSHQPGCRQVRKLETPSHLCSTGWGLLDAEAFWPSASRSAPIICSSVNRLLFMVPLLIFGRNSSPVMSHFRGSGHDNSRRYTTWRGTSRFGAEPRKDGVIHIKARPQHPMMLGKIERFWASIWGGNFCPSFGMRERHAGSEWIRRRLNATIQRVGKHDRRGLNAAWRHAAETWLRCQGLITVSVNGEAPPHLSLQLPP